MARLTSARLRVSAIAVATICLLGATICLLGGCGSSTKTVSVAASPSTSSATTTATGPTTPPTTSTATSTAVGGGASGGTPSTTRTRTATAPAFTEGKQGGSNSAEGLPAALAVVRAHGYTAASTSDYHPDQTLRVLIGTGAHSSDGYDKQAFFFVDGRYIGTDTSRPSAQISVVSQNDTEVTLAYQLYRPNDPLCCPGGGTARVRFQLNNGHLTPLDPIPPVSSTNSTSRQ